MRENKLAVHTDVPILDTLLEYPITRRSFSLARQQMHTFYQEIYGNVVAANTGVKTPKIVGWNDLTDPPSITFWGNLTVQELKVNNIAMWEFVGRTLSRIHSLKVIDQVNISPDLCRLIPAPKIDHVFRSGGSFDATLARILNRKVGFEGLCDLLFAERMQLSSDSDTSNEYIGFIYGKRTPISIVVDGGGLWSVDRWETSHFSDFRFEYIAIRQFARAFYGAKCASALLSGYTQIGGIVELPERVERLGILKWIADEISFLSIEFEKNAHSKLIGPVVSTTDGDELRNMDYIIEVISDYFPDWIAKFRLPIRP